MFFYNLKNFDGFIDDSLSIHIKEQIDYIDKIINLYKQKKDSLFTMTNQLINLSSVMPSDDLSKDFYKSITSLKLCFEEVDSLCTFASDIKDSLNVINNLCKNGIDKNKDEIKADLIEYNKKQDKLSNNIFNFENELTMATNSVFQLSLVMYPSKHSLKSKLSKHSQEIFDFPIPEVVGDNNILIVSEKDQRAYLPYRIAEVEETLKKSPDLYTSLKDVVYKNYVVSLDKFKNSSISRFRESFHLMHFKEKASIVKSLDLGLELMFKYNLNPIIIAACRNLDELDIYLDCLEENEVNKFKCFDIRFEIRPKVK